MCDNVLCITQSMQDLRKFMADRIKEKNQKTMNIKKAIQILEMHNRWRRYNGCMTKSPKMADPKDLGQAIDTVVNYFKEN